MIERWRCENVFRQAVLACSPQRQVESMREMLASTYAVARETVGIAVGKAAAAMARGVGPVTRGLVVTPPGEVGVLPAGWTLRVAAHPHPDATSVAAGAEVRELVEQATDEDVVIALISGGASALIEQPLVPLAELAAVVARVMAVGASIGELNVVRKALSAIKGGRLAEDCGARIITLVASDVVDDDVATVGSGPTIGPWVAAPGVPVDAGAAADHRRRLALEVLARAGIVAPAVLHAPIASHVITRRDTVHLVASMRQFARAVATQLNVPRLMPAMTGSVDAVADRLVAEAAPCVAWGEPTLRVPEPHGEGGRAQHLALVLARNFAGSNWSAFVAGSDGIDGPAPRARPTPAGAYVDGSTWARIVAAGIDPGAALARCDAGTALAAVDALVVTGPTGVNYADIAIIG
ncbi:MAG: DUF4147 domain-containing protein [Kofleriaceae bacterium]